MNMHIRKEYLIIKPCNETISKRKGENRNNDYWTNNFIKERCAYFTLCELCGTDSFVSATGVEHLEMLVHSQRPHPLIMDMERFQATLLPQTPQSHCTI